MHHRLLPLALVLSAAAPACAGAAVIEKTVNVTATNFTSFENVPSPVDKVSLQFSVRIDTDGGFESTVHSFTLGYPVTITYVGAFYDYLQVATSPVSPIGHYVRPGLSEFGFTLSGLASGNVGTGQLSYSTDDPAATWSAGEVDVSVTAPAVPEPATWFMMLAGFAAIGSFLRRGRMRTRVA